MSRKIWLTQGQHTIVDDDDYAWLKQWTWFARYNQNTDSYYATRIAGPVGERYDVQMHREILGLKRGDLRQGDHIHHNTLDNRRNKLRIATPRENVSNNR